MARSSRRVRSRSRPRARSSSVHSQQASPRRHALDGRPERGRRRPEGSARKSAQRERAQPFRRARATRFGTAGCNTNQGAPPRPRERVFRCACCVLAAPPKQTAAHSRAVLALFWEAPGSRSPNHRRFAASASLPCEQTRDRGRRHAVVLGGALVDRFRVVDVGKIQELDGLPFGLRVYASRPADRLP